MTQPMPPEVRARFDQYPLWAQIRLSRIRQLILDVAALTPGVGEIEETLRWGEPAYLTSRTGSGSLIRVDWKARNPDCVSIFFHCQTNLVEMFRHVLGDRFTFEGNRAIHINRDESVQDQDLALCMKAALTYHLHKRQTPEDTAK